MSLKSRNPTTGERHHRVKRNDSEFIVFEMALPTAKVIKVGAARRQLLLNRLLVKMWKFNRENKRAV